MNYKNFRTVFNKLFIANDFPDKWWAVRYESHWNNNCYGGLPVDGTEEAKRNYSKNPQYFFQPMEDCSLFVSLGQLDGRTRGEDGKYSPYPFA